LPIIMEAAKMVLSFTRNHSPYEKLMTVKIEFSLLFLSHLFSSSSDFRG